MLDILELPLRTAVWPPILYTGGSVLSRRVFLVRCARRLTPVYSSPEGSERCKADNDINPSVDPDPAAGSSEGSEWCKADNNIGASASPDPASGSPERSERRRADIDTDTSADPDPASDPASSPAWQTAAER